MDNILLIEDEVDLRESITEMLTYEGYHVISSFDGENGLHKLAESSPDLILCDIMMPQIDGFEVLSKVKEDENISSIPFVFITALTERQNHRKGMDLGADDYLTKPFTREELLGVINNQKIKQKVRENVINTELKEFQNNIALSLPHEFVTNLGLIIGFGELIKEISLEIEHNEIIEMSSNIIQSGQKLHEIIKKYLMYLELEVVKPVKSKPIIDKIDSGLLHVIQKISKLYNRESDYMADLVDSRLSINREYFYFAMDQLIDNAFKFSAKGQIVQLKAENLDGYLVISIRDQGNGFPTENFRKINAFQQFNRMEFEQQGIGLGLFLSKVIVEKFGGTINVSKNPDRGTLVKVSFPIVEANISE